MDIIMVVIATVDIMEAMVIIMERGKPLLNLDMDIIMEVIATVDIMEAMVTTMARERPFLNLDTITDTIMDMVMVMVMDMDITDRFIILAKSSFVNFISFIRINTYD